MKLLSAITLMMVAIGLLGGNVDAQKNCPSGRPNCLCPEVYQPVCSTQGCNYGNRCKLSCAGGKYAYDGVCK